MALLSEKRLSTTSCYTTCWDATVTSVLPLVENPPSDTAAPILYRGIKLDVNRWFGGGQPSASIVVYHQGSGTFTRSDRKLIDYVVEATPEFAVGQAVLVPIRLTNYYGVPLAADEYWAVGDGRGAYVLDGQDARRAVSLEARAPKSANLRDADTLPELLRTISQVGKTERNVR